MEPIIKPQEFTAAPTFKPQPYEASGDALVSGQVSRLIGQNSPYIQSARANAAMTAADRGMLNSSGAAGWGEKAAIDAALPIAQQDAGYYQSRGLADQQGIIQSGLQQQQATDTAGHYGVQAGYSSQLQDQEAKARAALSTQEFGQQGQLLAQQLTAEEQRQAKDIAAKFGLSQQEAEQRVAQARVDASLQAGLYGVQAGHSQRLQAQAERASLTESRQEQTAAMAREQLAQNANTARQSAELAVKQRLATMELSQKDQSDLQSALQTYGDTYQRAVNEVLQNQDMTAAARTTAINRLTADYKLNANLAASLAGIPLRWR